MKTEEITFDYLAGLAVNAEKEFFLSDGETVRIISIESLSKILVATLGLLADRERHENGLLFKNLDGH